MENKEEELTPREQAIKVIQEGGSVVVNGISYTLRGEEGANNIKSVRDLPGEEVFVVDNPELRDSTLAKMQKDMADMKAKYEALEKTKVATQEAAKAPAAVEAKEGK